MTFEELKRQLNPESVQEEENETEGGEISTEQAQMVIGSLIANLSDSFRMKPG